MHTDKIISCLWTYLDESQAGIKVARRNISNFRYANDTTLTAESKKELKSLLMKVKVQFSLATQSCPTLCNRMDCSPPVSSIHGILQARILLQFSSVTQSCPTLCHPMNCSHPMMASLSITNSWSLLRLAIETRTSNHPFAVQCAFSLRFCIFGLNGQLCTVHSGGAVWLSGMSEKVWMAQGNLLLIATTTCAFWDG